MISSICDFKNEACATRPYDTTIKYLIYFFSAGDELLNSPKWTYNVFVACLWFPSFVWTVKAAPLVCRLCFFSSNSSLILSRGTKRWSAEERATCQIWRVLIGSLKADRWIDQVSGHLCGHEARFPGGTLMWTWAAVWPLTSEEVWSVSRPVDQLISSLIQMRERFKHYQNPFLVRLWWNAAGKSCLFFRLTVFKYLLV